MTKTDRLSINPLSQDRADSSALRFMVLRRLCQVCGVILFLVISESQVCAATNSISIDAPRSLLQNPVARSAINDTVTLLRKSFPDATVTLDAPHASIRLLLPKMRSSDGATSPPIVRPPQRQKVPDPSYRWRSKVQAGAILLRLHARSPEGVAAGLYGLLQEKLGFRFYHPRESIIPVLHRWPLPGSFDFAGTPHFEKRGFHLHTLHPIELTAQLHDPAIPGALDDIKAYLDWLARNGQNTFQFFLLRDVNRAKWPSHARLIVDYAHSRGIRCGVEISLSMIQQQAFQAITLLRPYPSYRNQIDETLAWLFQAPWDMITLEATMGEHLPFLDRLLPGVQAHLERQVAERYGALLLYATHVIRTREGAGVRRPQFPGSGILIHTVMCYSASEGKAPVYGNANQCFMLEAAKAEHKRRETWYWPESSYWVGFDSSVPLVLLPYLEVRHHDIDTMARLGLAGHLTFSSGWEWSYWLMDWSNARWSWRLSDNGHTRATAPLSRLSELLPDAELAGLWKAALTLQNHYLKEKELLRYMSALTPFSELPAPFAKPFQPEPGFSYSWLLHGADQREKNLLVQGPLTDLEQYAFHMGELIRRMEARLDVRKSGGMGAREIKLAEELIRGLEVTALRARHRAFTLRALVARHGGNDRCGKQCESEALLEKARLVRGRALQLVARQEGIYRYAVENIGRRHAGMTAYPFGYLYPVSNLFFWEREEEQVRQERFDAFFMNLWDMRRTLGLESLIFR